MLSAADFPVAIELATPAPPVAAAVLQLHDVGVEGVPHVKLEGQHLSGDDRYAMQTSRVQTNAYVDPDETSRTVHLNAWTRLYERAQRGDRRALRQLASILAHEAYHAKNGASEAGAYDEQLRALRLLGGERDPVVKEILAAREYAVSRQRIQ